MKNYVYYIILKNYKGILKKKHIGNTHLFFIPVTTSETFYLALIGKITNEDNSFVCQLINRLPRELRHKIVEEQKKEFKNRYEVLEVLICEPQQLDEEKFKIKIPSKGNYFLSDLNIEINLEYTTDNQRIYNMNGKLNLETKPVSGDIIKSIGFKKLALVKKRIF